MNLCMNNNKSIVPIFYRLIYKLSKTLCVRVPKYSFFDLHKLKLNFKTYQRRNNYQ